MTKLVNIDTIIDRLQEQQIARVDTAYHSIYEYSADHRAYVHARSALDYDHLLTLVVYYYADAVLRTDEHISKRLKRAAERAHGFN